MATRIACPLACAISADGVRDSVASPLPSASGCRAFSQRRRFAAVPDLPRCLRAPRQSPVHRLPVEAAALCGPCVPTTESCADLLRLSARLPGARWRGCYRHARGATLPPIWSETAKGFSNPQRSRARAPHALQRSAARAFQHASPDGSIAPSSLLMPDRGSRDSAAGGERNGCRRICTRGYGARRSSGTRISMRR